MAACESVLGQRSVGGERAARRACRIDRRWTSAAIALAAVVLGASPAWSQRSCDDANDCTSQDICLVDGTCKGTPRSNGSPCTLPLAGDCVISGQCMTLPIVNTSFCAPLETKPAGTPCTIPGITDLLGQCLLSATCAEEGFCQVEAKTCEQPEDKCSVASCEPSSGQCRTTPQDCTDECSTGQCDPGTGECVNVQPSNEGGSCDDGNPCTSGDRCRSGTCTGQGGGEVPTTTRTPTHTLPVTSTPTPQPTVTPTPTTTRPAIQCVGDCDDSGDVTIDEILTAVNILLNNARLDACPSLDLDGNGEVTIHRDPRRRRRRVGRLPARAHCDALCNLDTDRAHHTNTLPHDDAEP